MRRRVVVTGIGAVSPLGLTAEASWSAALEGRSGVRAIDFFDASPLKTRIAGIVQPFELKKLVTPRVAVPATHRRNRFALAAAEMAVRDAGIEIEREPARVAVSFGSNESHFQPEQIGPCFAACYDGERFPDGALGDEILRASNHEELYFQEAQQTVSLLSIHYGAEGPARGCLTACAAGSQAINEALRLIRRGDADIALAGGTDSMFSPIKLVGFGSLGALSRRNDEPQRASRPFDALRDGFVLGEGAGVLVLEELEHARARGARIHAEVLGGGIALETYHLTAMSPDAAGPSEALRRALADARVDPKRVCYVNAHGTSTIENDAAETAAIKTVFGERAWRLPVSSTKSMTGHLVAAAGALEAVFTIFALRDQVAPPTINYETPDPACDLDYVPNVAREIDGEVAISNSFGFGGQNVSLVFGALR